MPTETAPKYRVLADCVLIKPEPVKDYTEAMGYSHVIAPAAYRIGPQDLPLYGTVQTMGPDCTGLVKVGERVLYGKFGWAKLQVDEQTHYAIVRERDILAVAEA